MSLLDRVTPKVRRYARQILDEGTIEQQTRSCYTVTPPGSDHGTTTVYRKYDHWRCKTCQGGKSQKDPCSHILAVLCRIHDVRIDPPEKPVFKTDTPRDWKTRRHAIEAWPSFFAEYAPLLADVFEEPIPPPRRGRPSASLRDRLLTTLLWLEEGSSMQDAAGRIKQHALLSSMDKALSFTQVHKFLDDPETTDLLDRALLVSAAVGAPYETEAGIDGTYFLTTRRSPDSKPRPERKTPARAPRLAVPITMYATNLVPAVATPMPPAEAPWSIPLLHRTLSVFNIQQFSADGGYVMKELELHAQVQGYRLVRPAKTGSAITHSTKPEDLAFNRTVLERLVNPGAYWRQREKRRNVETLNSTNKHAYGTSIRCRNPVAQGNEIRLRFLLHNLKRLCHLKLEREISIDFRFAKDLVDRSEWIPMDRLHRIYNGPKRIRHIQIIDPRRSKATDLHADAPRPLIPAVAEAI